MTIIRILLRLIGAAVLSVIVFLMICFTYGVSIGFGIASHQAIDNGDPMRLIATIVVAFIMVSLSMTAIYRIGGLIRRLL
jgi:hypothetical protein